MLSAKANRTLGSLSYNTKVSEIYGKSEIITTRKLAGSYSDWNRKAIESRAGELAKLAIEAWPIDK